MGLKLLARNAKKQQQPQPAVHVHVHVYMCMHMLNVNVTCTFLVLYISSGLRRDETRRASLLADYLSPEKETGLLVVDRTLEIRVTHRQNSAE